MFNDNCWFPYVSFLNLLTNALAINTKNKVKNFIHFSFAGIPQRWSYWKKILLIFSCIIFKTLFLYFLNVLLCASSVCVFNEEKETAAAVENDEEE